MSDGDGQAAAGAAVIDVALTVWLAHRCRWAECVYVGLQVAALITSTHYMSIPRSMLLWFPLWLLGQEPRAGSVVPV
ncbi:hypothetical protein ABZ297_37930 [Nonomuraea sp. NPDC005983]|uniref:hypothetical protein n=1 Tax=Nonomuraea sp. NPDC005983 TaxID=3155595 RepID=UPI0033B4F7C7